MANAPKPNNEKQFQPSQNEQISRDPQGQMTSQSPRLSTVPRSAPTEDQNPAPKGGASWRPAPREEQE